MNANNKRTGTLGDKERVTVDGEQGTVINSPTRDSYIVQLDSGETVHRMRATIERMENVSRKPCCVLLDGPQSAQNFDGDEVAEWTVCIGDDEGEPVDNNISRFRDYGSAVLYATKLARNGRFELVDDSFPI